MTQPSPSEAAMRLADVLARENAALAALDFAAATRLLAEKEAATAAFVAAQNAQQNAVAPSGADAAAARRLAALAAENRRLLARALRIQKRVLGVIARAVPKGVGAVAGYGAQGAPAARPAPPLIVSARV